MDQQKIIFMGTPKFAAEILSALIAQQYTVIAVVTQPDKPVGRKQTIQFSAVKEVAIANNIEVIQPVNIKNDYQRIAELAPDLIITAAYGQIVPRAVLDIPRIICLNVHGSLLPKYRGGAPVHYAVINGDKKTGVTIMEMVEKMDAGGIISQREFSIADNDTTGDVFAKMTDCAQALLLATLPSIFAQTFQITPQNEADASYSPTITKADEYIDFNDSVTNVYNKIRGLVPFPVGYFLFQQKRYKIYQAEIIKKPSEVGMIMNISKNGIEIGCQDGVINITEIQPSGKKRISVHDYVNGKIELQINDRCD